MSISSTTLALPHLLLIGSTGRTGRLVICDALTRGHSITAVAREPSSLNTLLTELSPAHRARIAVVKADPTYQSDLSSTLEATLADASSNPIVIVSTLGQTRRSGNPWAAVTSPPMFMKRTAEALVAALNGLPAESKQRFQKLVVMSMFGAKDSFANLHWLLKPVMWYSNMWQTIEDHNGLDTLVRGQNQIGWVMIRPSMLKEGPSKPIKILGENGEGDSWFFPSGITVSSVVTFMLDACVDTNWDGKTPVVVN